MPLVYPNMQMSEVVEEHPSLIPVINNGVTVKKKGSINTEQNS